MCAFLVAAVSIHLPQCSVYSLPGGSNTGSGPCKTRRSEERGPGRADSTWVRGANYVREGEGAMALGCRWRSSECDSAFYGTVQLQCHTALYWWE